MSPLLAFIALASTSTEVRPLLRSYRSRVVLRPHGRTAGSSATDPRVARIIAQTCAEYGVSLDEIATARRGTVPAQARHVLAARLYLDAALSLPKVGRLLGYSEHSAAFYAAQRGAAILRREWPRRVMSREARYRPSQRIRYVGFDRTERPV